MDRSFYRNEWLVLSFIMEAFILVSENLFRSFKYQ